MVVKPGHLIYSLSTRFGGERVGVRGGGTTAGNFITGQRWL
jgi:hypothetical protein